MENETLLSVGIDIGTTTTHLIISKIAIEVEGGFGTVPHAKISDKKIVYKSPVYFTPLDKRGNIDIDAVAGIINSEYQIAGVSKSDLQSGAVIITGESSKKIMQERCFKKSPMRRVILSPRRQVHSLNRSSPVRASVQMSSARRAAR